MMNTQFNAVMAKPYTPPCRVSAQKQHSPAQLSFAGKKKEGNNPQTAYLKAALLLAAIALAGCGGKSGSTKPEPEQNCPIGQVHLRASKALGHAAGTEPDTSENAKKAYVVDQEAYADYEQLPFLIDDSTSIESPEDRQEKYRRVLDGCDINISQKELKQVKDSVSEIGSAMAKDKRNAGCEDQIKEAAAKIVQALIDNTDPETGGMTCAQTNVMTKMFHENTRVKQEEE